MGVNSEILYLKIEQNTIVFDRHVVLNDIAKMECTNEAILRQLKQKKIYSFTNQKNEKKENFCCSSDLHSGRIPLLFHSDSTSAYQLYPYDQKHYKQK